MIFSSHRFGNLTRDADIILYVMRPDTGPNCLTVCTRYMNDATIVENGRHEELLKLGGEYARIWTLQAQAFLP